jgi:hypothetical protein
MLLESYFQNSRRHLEQQGADDSSRVGLYCLAKLRSIKTQQEA